MGMLNGNHGKTGERLQIKNRMKSLYGVIGMPPQSTGCNVPANHSLAADTFRT